MQDIKCQGKKEMFFRIEKSKMYILLPVFYLSLSVLFYFTRETKIIIENNNIVIESIYGESIPIDEVETIELLDELPTINMRTNGFALGYILIGYFNVKEEGNVKMFIHSSGLLIKLKTDSKIFYFNRRDSVETFNLYGDILANMN